MSTTPNKRELNEDLEALYRDLQALCPPDAAFDRCIAAELFDPGGVGHAISPQRDLTRPKRLASGADLELTRFRRRC